MEPDVFVLEQPEVKELYSRNAIWRFSAFFNPIVGGVLLAQNLKDINNHKVANQVLAFSVLYLVFEIVLFATFDTAPRPLSYILNFAGGAFLTEYFYRKYMPAAGSIKKKSIVKPLIISLAITIPFVALMIWAQTVTQ